MTETQPTPQRPLIVTIVSILNFVGIFLYTIVSIVKINEESRSIGEAQFLMVFILIVLGTLLMGTIGLWKMKRWGLYIFTLSSILDIFVSEKTTAGFFEMAVSVLFLVLVWSHYQKMT